MIKSKDREYYIGASDTSFVVGNWKTKSFEKWFGTKLGIYSIDYVNDSMRAGTFWEHRILDVILESVPDLRRDEQVIDGRLRINLDGCTDNEIYEVKTHRADKPFKVTKAYRQQTVVEMYGTGIRTAWIVAYGLEDKDYNNYYGDVDKNRLTKHLIDYDEGFINSVYLPRFYYLSACLDRGVFPKESEI